MASNSYQVIGTPPNHWTIMENMAFGILLL